MPLSNNRLVVLVGPSAERYKGGIAHFTSSLANVLNDKCRLLFISWSRLYPPFLTKRNFIDRTSAKNKAKTNAKFLLSYLNPLSWIYTAKAIAAFKADTVILTWVHPVHAPIYLLLIPLIRNYNNSEIVLLCHNVEPHESFWGAKILSKHVYQKVDSIIVHSASEASKIKQILNKPNIIQLFHPVYDFLPFSSKKSKTDCENFKLLFFGLIRPYKGLDLLLDALESLVIQGHKIKLTVAGESFSEEGNNALLKDVCERGLVDYVQLDLRYIPNNRIADYFLDCDLVVLPYRSATSSGPLMMAMHFAKPVIATNVGGLPDYVFERRNGFLCEPNAESIANSIIKATVHTWDESEIKKSAESFSWNRYVDLALS